MANWRLKHVFPGRVTTGRDSLLPDSQLVVVNPDNSIGIRDLESGRQTTKFDGHRGHVRSAKFLNSQFLVSSSPFVIYANSKADPDLSDSPEELSSWENARHETQGDGTKRIWDIDFGCEAFNLESSTGVRAAVISLELDIAVVTFPFDCQSCGSETHVIQLSTKERLDQFEYHPIAQ